MTQVELFAGIGGFGLAGKWAGIETVCQVEIDPFCQSVLKKNFPNAHKHKDIQTFNGYEWQGVDIVSGGFPCQPFSVSGKRKGIEDTRALWPEMLRVIREIQPAYVVGENVTGIISMELDTVLSNMEKEGYATQAFIIPACATNAPHRRDRVWIVGYNADAYSKRFQKHITTTITNKAARFNCKYSIESWNEWTNESPVYRMDDGISKRLDRNLSKRIKALGNAIVPQVAYQIFKAIIEIEKQNIP